VFESRDLDRGGRTMTKHLPGPGLTSLPGTAQIVPTP